MEQVATRPIRESKHVKCIEFSRGQLAYLRIKRLFDVILSLLALIVLLPVFLAVAIAIKVEDPDGKVIYYQDRIGRSGRLFRLYKFRSMRSDTPELSTHEFTNAQSYITKVGSFIRKTSIDELPQLWNVVIGNMSLVGPRPLLPRERAVHVKRFYYGVYQMRPGITGMAQTHGRDDMNDEDKVNWDRKYVENISLKLDIALIWRTAVKVLKREGIIDHSENDQEKV